MVGGTMVALDPSALSAFAASLANLPREEIAKAKKLFVLNAIADLKAARAVAKGMLIAFGVMSIIPIFLIVFIPAMLSFRSTIRAQRQKIVNAIEVWREDLGASAEELIAQVSA